MPDQVTAFAPGRVNLVGEHTDYNDGLALPFAIEAGVTVRATALDGARIEATAEDLGEADAFELGAIEPADGWRAYVRGVVAELQADGYPLRGARLAFSGTVPQGSGLSSSAALECALALALLGVAGVEGAPRVDLARVLSRAENDWTGAETGLLDQLASLLGDDGHGVRIDFRRLREAPEADHDAWDAASPHDPIERVPIDLGDWTLATVDSGAAHSLAAGSGYEARRRECRAACAALGVDSLRDAPPDATLADATLMRRLRHVRTENARVDAAVDALAAGDVAALGPLLDASHTSLRDDYEASVPEVEDAVARCKAAGATGARMVGGGFGGHVLALFPPGSTLPDDALVVRPGPGAGLR